MPPLSMWLASVTSLDQTSNCHLTRPSTPQCTRPVWMPTRMFTFTAITSRTRLSKRGSKEREGVKRVPHYKSRTIQSHNLHCSIVCGLCCVLYVCVLCSYVLMWLVLLCVCVAAVPSVVYAMCYFSFYSRYCVNHIEPHFNGTVCMIRARLGQTGDAVITIAQQLNAQTMMLGGQSIKAER